jgi:uncharacterized membrane protein
LSLACVTQHEALQFHPFSCKWCDFIFMYGRIRSFCVYTYMYTYIYTDNVFSIYSLATGHVGWFHSLAIVKSAPINTGVQILSCILIYAPLDMCPNVLRWDHKVGLFLVFWSWNLETTTRKIGKILENIGIGNYFLNIQEIRAKYWQMGLYQI